MYRKGNSNAFCFFFAETELTALERLLRESGRQSNATDGVAKRFQGVKVSKSNALVCFPHRQRKVTHSCSASSLYTRAATIPLESGVQKKYDSFENENYCIAVITISLETLSLLTCHYLKPISLILRPLQFRCVTIQ